jgi:predicted dehydrogenase
MLVREGMLRSRAASVRLRLGSLGRTSGAKTRSVKTVMVDTMGFEPDPPIRVREFRIGCVGAGMIMAECHLAAYADAGFPVVAIASRNEEHAAQVAARWRIPKVHATPTALIEDPDIAILDIAFPPDQQPALIRHALKQPHIQGILAQKPLSLTLDEAIAIRDEADAAGKILSVNQNMRYDQSMRVLKQILDRGDLGAVVFAQIDMHAIPHWQTFLQKYSRLTLANMSVHHLDVLRFLFGEPTEIYTAARTDPRTTFEHTDGITVSTLKFASGVLALSLEDVWSGPREPGFDSDIWIRWRVEGVDGVAQGTIGWPTGARSTLTYASKTRTGGKWISPTWDTMWFPDAFKGVMEQLQYAVRSGTAPALSVADNVKTVALIEAGYRSLAQGRTVRVSEFQT